MTDSLSKAQRSQHMARIRGRDTRPEIAMRRLLHFLGYRYRLQFKGLPGRPDIAFPARKKVIFVHGCFWHSHENCEVAHIPHTRSEYWAAKFARNKARDQRQQQQVIELGWEILVVWECELSPHFHSELQEKVTAFLGSPKYR